MITMDIAEALRQEAFIPVDELAVMLGRSYDGLTPAERSVDDVGAVRAVDLTRHPKEIVGALFTPSRATKMMLFFEEIYPPIGCAD